MEIYIHEIQHEMEEVYSGGVKTLDFSGKTDLHAYIRTKTGHVFAMAVNVDKKDIEGKSLKGISEYIESLLK